MTIGLGHVFEQAKIAGFRHGIVECSMEFSTRGLRRLGGIPVSFVEYSSFLNDGEYVFQCIPKLHKGITLFTLDLHSPAFNPFPVAKAAKLAIGVV